MSKLVKLLTTAMVGGVSRTPAEGVLHLPDDQADRLIADQTAEDVTGDFTATQRKAVPVMALTALAPADPGLPPAQHLTEIVPNAADAGAPQPTPAATAAD